MEHFRQRNHLKRSQYLSNALHPTTIREDIDRNNEYFTGDLLDQIKIHSFLYRKKNRKISIEIYPLKRRAQINKNNSSLQHHITWSKKLEISMTSYLSLTLNSAKYHSNRTPPPTPQTPMPLSLMTTLTINNQTLPPTIFVVIIVTMIDSTIDVRADYDNGGNLTV